ncbi:MAG: hypothetical protein EKK41_14195 [Hyphomicrobiales bacterium]|nr:MAG: hypothetical protein EKK41_14195 [Hyphomicrobiales bacterium]
MHASHAHPRLAIQGDAVEVDLPHGRVRATAVGPQVPSEGRFPVPSSSPCTFVVTFDDPVGIVPLAPSAFTIVDELGNLHRPRVAGIRSGRLATGRRTRLVLRDVLPVGAGRLRWAPGGGRPLVYWDFDVEID